MHDSRLTTFRPTCVALVDLVATVKRLGIGSIALPPLGCGYGGLPWEAVHPLIESAFSALDEVHVLLYAPTGVPEASGMPNRTRKPALTSGQAALVMLIERYLQGMLDPIVSLLELQCDTLAHHALGVDGVDQRINIGLEQITLGNL